MNSSARCGKSDVLECYWRVDQESGLARLSCFFFLRTFDVHVFLLEKA